MQSKCINTYITKKKNKSGTAKFKKLSPIKFKEVFKVNENSWTKLTDSRLQLTIFFYTVYVCIGSGVNLDGLSLIVQSIAFFIKKLYICM